LQLSDDSRIELWKRAMVPLDGSYSSCVDLPAMYAN